MTPQDMLELCHDVAHAIGGQGVLAALHSVVCHNGDHAPAREVSALGFELRRRPATPATTEKEDDAGEGLFRLGGWIEDPEFEFRPPDFTVRFNVSSRDSGRVASGFRGGGRGRANGRPDGAGKDE